jgi:16S rRNA (cytidine1402-2'-O)-methyltransferase
MARKTSQRARSHNASPAATPRPTAAAGTLYVVATPIGNLGDLSPRAIETLKTAAVVACEDTRVTGGLLHRFAIATPMLAYHDHNAERMRPQLLARLAAGESVALVSDAGTPLISDPGYKLVGACIAQGIAVVPVPGPSAPLAALMAAGLPTDRFYFGGFLPAKSKARREALAAVAALQATLVFFESPHRLAETLADMAAVLGERDAVVARELTKLHEEFRRGPLRALAAHYAAAAPRGEIVVAVAGAVADERPAVDIDAALREALANRSVRDAAEAVAALSGRPRREVYARALKLGAARNVRD